MDLQCIFCLWALFMPIFMVNGQSGNFTLSVKLFKYQNPDSMVFGVCCNLRCGSECDNFFTFCLSPAGTDRNQCSLGRFQSEVSSQGDNINFQVDTEELGIPNPLRFTNITNLETVQLYIRVLDDNPILDVPIDWFLAEVDLKNGLSRQMTLSGENEIAEIQLRLDVGCSENFYGPNCDIFCIGGSRICEEGSPLSSSTQALVGVIVVILLLAVIAVTVAIVVYILWKKGKVRLPKKHAGALNSNRMTALEASVTPGDNPTYGGAVSEPTSAPTGTVNNHKYEYISNNDRTHRLGAREGDENTYTYITNIQSVMQHSSTPVPASDASEIPGHYETSENFMRTASSHADITTALTPLSAMNIPAHYETMEVEPQASANKDPTTIESHYEFEPQHK